MASRQARMKFTLQRARGFLSTFSRSKRGMIGVGIIILFVAVALAAPVISHNDPVKGWNKAGDNATPSWYDIVFPSQPQSLDMLPVKDGFNNSASLSAFNITSSSNSVGTYYDPTVGDAAPGSLAVAYNKNLTSQTGASFANITKTFYYPYRAPLNYFIGTVYFYVVGSTYVDQTGTIQLDVPVHISVLLIDMNKTTTTTTIISNTTTTTTPLQNTTVTTTTKTITHTSTVVRYDLSQINEETHQAPIVLDKITSPTTAWIPPVIGNTATNFNSQNMRGSIGTLFYDPSRVIFNTTSPHDYQYAIEITFLTNNIASKNPNAQTVVYVDDVSFQGFGTSFGILGTDNFGRDLFSQIVYGARISLLVGLVATAIGIGLGLIVGLVAGYSGGMVDELLMRFTDALLVIPSLPLLMVLVAVLGPSLWNIILVLGLLGWMGFARTIRSMILSLRERPFVESAKAVGAGSMHIMTTHILPNIMALVYVNLAMTVPSNIVSEASLSFLGFSDPNQMSWGKMLSSMAIDRSTVGYWWWVVPPGLLISIASLSFIFIGYALDDILNPRLRERR